jgi:hypothetical protein
LFGHGFISLPRALAVVSYATFAGACALPWLLFKKYFGVGFSLLLTLLLLFVPLGGWDYTVFGTIGNMKFLLFFVAFLLIWYRVIADFPGRWNIRLIVVDISLLALILTNITIIALLPIALVRYRSYIIGLIRNRRLTRPSYGLAFIVVLGVIGVIYVGAMYKLGIPKMPGYLDGPISYQGLLNTIFRASWYAVLHPLYTSLNSVFIDLLLVGSVAILFVKRYRLIGAAGIYAVVVGTVGFAYNRPGVTQYFRGFLPDGGPGQFFYGCTMIFLFIVVWILRDQFKTMQRAVRGVVLASIGLYMVLTIPIAGYGLRSYQTYAWIPDVYHQLPALCAQTKANDNVNLQIYPTNGWYMNISHERACKDVRY